MAMPAETAAADIDYSSVLGAPANGVSAREEAGGTIAPAVGCRKDCGTPTNPWVTLFSIIVSTGPQLGLKKKSFYLRLCF